MQKIGVVNFAKPLNLGGGRQLFKLPSIVKKISSMFIILNNVRKIQGFVSITKNIDLMEAAIILNNNADFKFRVPIQFASFFPIKDFTNLNSFISPLPFSGFEIPCNSKISENAEHTAIFELDASFRNIPEYGINLEYLVGKKLNAELYYTYEA